MGMSTEDFEALEQQAARNELSPPTKVLDLCMEVRRLREQLESSPRSRAARLTSERDAASELLATSQQALREAAAEKGALLVGWANREEEMQRALDAANARAEATEKTIRFYEDGITWMTTCTNCAQLMNANYEAFAKREAAEQREQALRAALEPLAQEISLAAATQSPAHARAMNKWATTIDAALAAAPAPEPCSDFRPAIRPLEHPFPGNWQIEQPCDHDWPTRDVAGGRRCHGCGEVVA